MSKIRFIKCRKTKSPERGTKSSSWIDFFIPDDFISTIMEVWDTILIPSWLKCIIEDWYDMVLKEKSWIALKKNLQCWSCVIDSDYRWEFNFHFTKIAWDVIQLNPWDKIVQWIIRPVILWDIEMITEEEFERENNTKRSSGWFWSTGES